MPPSTMKISRNVLPVISSSATITPRPTNHIAGAIAAIARPPSNGVSGTRLRCCAALRMTNGGMAVNGNNWLQAAEG